MDYQFLDVRLRELEKIVEEETDKRFEPKCRFCFDTGLVRGPNIDPSCHCEAGKPFIEMAARLRQ